MDNWALKLEQHLTKDTLDEHVNGTLTVLWRDWDQIIQDPPKMVYVSSVNFGEIKGPHLHTKRNSYFSCIHGKVIFVIQDNNRTYHEIESSENNPVLVFVPKNVASAHINIHDGISRVIALADVAWRPNDNEMKNVKFDDYNWKKWTQKNIKSKD